MQDRLPSPAEVEAQLASAPVVRRLAFDAREVEAWDTGLLVFVLKVLDDAKALHLAVDRSGLPDGVRKLLDLAAAVPERDTKRGGTSQPLLARMGSATMAAASGAREMITFVGEATLALAQYGHINYLRNISEAFLKYLLFTEEAPMADPIRGLSDFTREFAAQGPRDQRGRSLREFDLRTRLFKYPCSYLIYSSAFDNLPPRMKEVLFRRLWEILSGGDSSPEFQRMPALSKRAILEILVDTKPGLPDYWKK
jgi:ABC-type transporter Mla MlaB component